ncbi:MAG: cytochrome P450 [Mycobacterium sp.]
MARKRYDIGVDELIVRSAGECPQRDVYGKLLQGPAVVDRGDDSPLLITRLEDVVFINQQKSVLGNGDAGTDMAAGQRLIPLDIDGEEHTKFRRLLDPLFAPKSKVSQLGGLEPEVRRLANALIDDFIDAGEVELYSQFCVPLPTIIFVRMLGLPDTDRQFFLQFKDDLVHAHTGSAEGDAELRMNAALRMFGYLDEQINLREADPNSYPGLLTGLVQTEVDGEMLTKQEQLNIAFLLMVAGLDTVTGALSCMFARLAGHPDEQQQLRDDPALIPSAVEELLRYESPVQWGHRLATEDLTLPSGYQVRAGDHMQLLWAAANLDESGCPAAAEVRFDRKANRHVAFASGTHRCLGSHLARMELRCAVEEFHNRTASYRIRDGETPQYPGGTVRSVSYLPLEFTPR